MDLVVDIYRLLLAPFLINKRLKIGTQDQGQAPASLAFLQPSTTWKIRELWSSASRPIVALWRGPLLGSLQRGLAPFDPRRPMLGLKERRQTAHD